MTSVHVAIVGPLPPPAGGMANQTRQLGELLAAEGISAVVVQVNAPYRPPWIARLPMLRALFRLAPYLSRLWRAGGRAEVFHIMANSGWSWHLYAAPAVWIAKMRGKRAIINYRGGGAEEFLAGSYFWMRPTLRMADLIVVPSGFLQAVFEKWGVATTVIPNVVNLRRFSPASAPPARNPDSPLLVITRNLEPVYDIATALKAFVLLLRAIPGARLTIAGSGPQRDELERLANDLSIAAQVRFAGRLDVDQVAALYQAADVAINPSLVDNMPNSLLEALASGVPVVSTNVGGVPYMVEDGKSALLVPPGDAQAMADALVKLIRDDSLAQALRQNGLMLVQGYAWTNVRDAWLSAYRNRTIDTRVPGLG